MSLVFDFGQGLRCGSSIRQCRCHWIIAAWFVFLHFFLVPLCWCAVSERQMCLFFAGGLAGVDKHLFQRVSLIHSYYFHDSTTKLYFRSTTRQCRCSSKQKQLSTVKKKRKISSMAKLKDSRSCFITRWRVFYKWVQLVQVISITIILLFNFEKKHLIRLSVSSKLQN